MEQQSQVIPQPIDKDKIRKIWRVAAILAAVTLIEFVIAFTIPAGGPRTFVFIALTIVKAFYIVAEFMHLGHERKSLIFSIMLPVVFIIFLIFILWYQGTAIFNILYG
ncbi:MAG: cytochrome c oxidase subunit 4 [Cyclobacteriaceae bacterium]|jgi:cytochrome c oxidase subunit 4